MIFFLLENVLPSSIIILEQFNITPHFFIAHAYAEYLMSPDFVHFILATYFIRDTFPFFFSFRKPLSAMETFPLASHLYPPLFWCSQV